MGIDSLRGRFALWTGLLLLGGLALFGAYVYFSMEHGLLAALDDALRLGAVQASSLLEVDNRQILLSSSVLEESPEPGDLRAKGLTVRFLDAGGRVLGGFGLDWSNPAPLPQGASDGGAQGAFQTIVKGGGEIGSRVYTLPVIDNAEIAGYVQAALSLESIRQTMGRLLTTLLLGAPLLTLLAATTGYGLAARALAPVDELTRAARRISAEDLSERIGLQHRRDELGRLAGTFDGMLARLDEAFRRERRFTADASHELRTPLAAMQAILSVTRARPRTPLEYEQALDDLSAETARLRGLTEDLLLLAREGSRMTGERERVNLAAVACDVCESMQPLAEAKGLRIECRAEDGLWLTGNRDGLIRTLVNLLDNAIKFTEVGTVTLSARMDGGLICVDVTDHGAGIPPEHLLHIFERFYRVDTSRSERGSGLGLAIAREITQAHGGQILATSLAGQGTTFSVRLPIS